MPRVSDANFVSETNANRKWKIDDRGYDIDPETNKVKAVELTLSHTQTFLGLVDLSSIEIKRDFPGDNIEVTISIPPASKNEIFKKVQDLNYDVSIGSVCIEIGSRKFESSVLTIKSELSKLYQLLHDIDDLENPLFRMGKDFINSCVDKCSDEALNSAKKLLAELGKPSLGLGKSR